MPAHGFLGAGVRGGRLVDPDGHPCPIAARSRVVARTARRHGPERRVSHLAAACSGRGGGDPRAGPRAARLVRSSGRPPRGAWSRRHDARGGVAECDRARPRSRRDVPIQLASPFLGQCRRGPGPSGGQRSGARSLPTFARARRRPPRPRGDVQNSTPCASGSSRPSGFSVRPCGISRAPRAACGARRKKLARSNPPALVADVTERYAKQRGADRRLRFWRGRKERRPTLWRPRA